MAITIALADSLRRWRRAGVTRRQLSALSDAQLADIGLERAQIEDVARGMVARHGTAPVRGNPVVAGVRRGMNLSPAFHAYIPRIGG